MGSMCSRNYGKGQARSGWDRCDGGVCCAGTPKDALRLNPKVLAGIYACNITSWQDPAIAALNPNLS